MKSILLIALFSILVTVCPAQTFVEKELNLDTFGTYTVNKAKVSDLLKHNSGGDYGYGLGFSYFPKLNFGFGADVNVRDAQHADNAFLDELHLNLIARVPIKNFAPQLIGGVGRNFETGDSTAHLGAGIEWRFNKRSGVFFDGRYQWSQHGGQDTLLTRLGLRFNF